MKQFTDAQIKALKYTGKPRKVYENIGNGFFIEVRSRTKSFKYQFNLNGRRSTVTLGTYPYTSLKTARQKFIEARALIEDGKNPTQEKKKRLAELEAERAAARTFQQIAEEYLATCSAWTEKHRDGVVSRLTTHVYPVLGSTPIADISAKQILNCLQLIEIKGQNANAHKTKQAINPIFRYAALHEYIPSDPMPSLARSLQPYKEKHHSAITHNFERLGPVLTAIDNSNSHPVIRCALQFLIRVFVRPGEMRFALWEEMDFPNSRWVIPATRMKARDNGDHIVPLSRQAITILREAQLYSGSEEYVFTTGVKYRGRVKPISENTASKAMKDCGISPALLKPHGVRHTASSFLNEHGYNKEAIELQLHHRRKGVEGVYNQSQHLETRIQMMQDYSNHLEQIRQNYIAKNTGK